MILCYIKLPPISLLQAFCEHLAEGMQNLGGKSLQNKLTRACKE